MHPLLRAALLVCPSEFRSRFGAQIAADQRQYRGTALFGACWNVVFSGLVMHVENLIRDFAFALRSLAKAPAYASVAILAFALAIGANVAVASVLDAVVLRPLPYADSGRLVLLSQGSSLQSQISYRNARDIEARNSTLSAVGLLRENGATLTGKGKPTFVPGWTVDASYFRVLGVPAQLGRVLNRRDLGRANVVISDRAWHSYFDAAPHVLGQTIRLDDRDYTIVGVMPPGFRDPVPGALAQRDFWMPVDPHSILAGSRVWTGFHGLARLAPGITPAAAAADARRIIDADAARDPQDFIDARGATIVPILQAVVGSTGTLLWMLYAAVGMVLLIACVNIANLTMARIGARERELVVRNALGASRARIISQLMTELLVLALAGGVAGTALAFGLLALLRSVFSQLLPRWEGVALSTPVLLYAVLLVLVTAAITGLLPVFARSGDMSTPLKNAGRSGDRGAGRRLRGGLVVVEVALAFAVVACAGLVLRSFVSLTHVDVGFDPRNTSVLTITLPYGARYNDPAQTNRFTDEAVAGLRSIPGVSDAAAAILAPFSFNSYPRAFTIPGRPDPHATVQTNAVSDGFFRTMRIPLLRGRDFPRNVRPGAPPEVIVSASFARRYFGTADAIGKQIALTPFVPNVKPVPQTIVGVAGETRTSFSRAPEPEIYVPTHQIPLALFYVVRTSSPSIPLARAAQAQFARIDPSVAPPAVVPYRELLDADAVRSQAAVVLFGILAALALVLSLAGIYAVTAYGVEQRTQEFGIRQAVGARASDILSNVLQNAFAQAALGIAGGLVLAAIFTRFLSGLLFETSPLDPATFAVVVILAMAAVLVAAAVPALRAARIQPAAAIRYE